MKPFHPLSSAKQKRLNFIYSLIKGKATPQTNSLFSLAFHAQPRKEELSCLLSYRASLGAAFVVFFFSSLSLFFINFINERKREPLKEKKRQLHSLSIPSAPYIHSFVFSLFSSLSGAMAGLQPITPHKEKEKTNKFHELRCLHLLYSFHNSRIIP